MHEEYSRIFIALIAVFFLQFVTLMSLYFTDRRYKLESKSGIRKVKMLTLTKCKYFFVYNRRSEGLITKYVFKCMIAYYVVNITLFTILIILIFLENTPPMTILTGILCFSNIGLLLFSGGEKK